MVWLDFSGAKGANIPATDVLLFSDGILSSYISASPNDTVADSDGGGVLSYDADLDDGGILMLPVEVSRLILFNADS
jgi:hypothetical protein